MMRKYDDEFKQNAVKKILDGQSAELVENGIFESVEDVRSDVFSYIEGYYNRIRLHSGLSYKSPLEFEKELKLKNKSRSSESFVS